MFPSNNSPSMERLLDQTKIQTRLTYVMETLLAKAKKDVYPIKTTINSIFIAASVFNNMVCLIHSAPKPLFPVRDMKHVIH